MKFEVQGSAHIDLFIDVEADSEDEARELWLMEASARFYLDSDINYLDCKIKENQ